MSLSASELKPSLTIVYKGEPYLILESEHAKLGRGPSFVRAKIKNLITSQIIETTLRDSDKIEPAFIEKKKLIFSYRDKQYYHFLDAENYEDFILYGRNIKSQISYFKENLEMTGFFYENKLVNLELPSAVVLKIVETEPGFKGNTVKAGSKPAKLETGLIVDVPLFIKEGDSIKVDTQNQQYLGRA